MKVVVLGAGLAGVSSAWYLAGDGHEVTVLDRQPGPALETSFANGGQISTSHAEPWANPGAPWQALKWLGREDAPLLWRLRADPDQWAWGLRFLRECTPSRTRANIVAILRLALDSRDRLRALRVYVTAEEHIEAIKMMTGWGDFTLDEAMRLSDRLGNLNRAHYLERNGGPGRKFDYPNARLYEEAVPSGRSQGARLTMADLDVMLDEYYVARGWGKAGNPSREVLLDLGLDGCIANLEREGLLGSLMAPLPPVRGERYKPKAF